MIPSVRPLVCTIALVAISAVVLGGCASGPERPRARPLPADVSFAGNWDSTWGRLILRQDGRRVSGTFTGYREGGVSGELDGDVWRFVWDQLRPRSHGRGYMQMSPDGQHLEGRWGYLKEDADGGRWAADRGPGGGF
jgi:hypothetical protein